MLKKYGTLFAVYICPNCGKKLHRSPIEVEMAPDEMVADLAHRFGMENERVVKFAQWCVDFPECRQETYSAIYCATFYQVLEDMEGE
jgi:hypothetical protein